MERSSLDVPLHVQCRQFLLADMPPGLTVLDVGCGKGDLMLRLTEQGCTVSGVDIDASLVAACRAAGLQVTEAQAEHLPLDDASVDAIVCSVVLPYTDERAAVSEWARVLRPGGAANITCHGIGYGLNYLLHGVNLSRRIYGSRMLLNTWFYRMSGRKLPGFLGDSLCQTSRRMRTYYRAYGLELVRERVVGTEMGCPRFICHRVRKPIRS